ncbi:unnamed protein product [Lepeophtheirus salmonis]|uniref:(salmon louse) hypothetical protein n=1 Tax=Lepeophtheirus salmonis TaxID=72036 RepID=A0A7R8CYT3_LEPSM|nr:unnamed protein product [Lepeophtheirus salmonis]CAF2943967.1 unnamed protein product [Lepeophtheirus salmonis]
MSVRDISEEAFDLIFEENSDSELEGEDGWRRVACDAKSSYAWKIQVYTGKLADGQLEKPQGMHVVLDLTEGLRCHNVSSFGTVRNIKPELPPALLASKEREVFSSQFTFTPTITLVSYLPKKNKIVVLLSTLHRDGSISDRDDRKPVIIMDYNRNKGGVDNLAMNHKRRVFLEQLGKALVAPLIEIRKNILRTEASAQTMKAFQSAGLTDRPDDQASTSTFNASKRKNMLVLP